MDNTDLYLKMQAWQNRCKIYFGDKVKFTLDNHSYEGFLTGFDIESEPLKPIIRYVNQKGNRRIVALQSDVVISKTN
ncbi:MAG: hypothetical protein JEZ14_20245 [Marinilabiliaceae bacterium]|nr:hypothetical protein [Marinilabiliaceae bacterium]